MNEPGLGSCAACDAGARGRFAWRAFLFVAGVALLSLVGLAAYELGRLHETREAASSPRPAAVEQLRPATGAVGGEIAGAPVAAASSNAPRLTTVARPQTGPTAAGPAVVTAAAEPQTRAGDTTECARYQAQIEGPLGRWDALVRSIPAATSVTRDRMLAQLRAIQGEVAAIPAPACAQRARDELLASMEAVIEALWRTPTGEDPAATAAFASAQDQLARARSEIASSPAAR